MKHSGDSNRNRILTQKRRAVLLFSLLTLPLSLSAISNPTHASPPDVEATQREAEVQIRRILEPLVEKYCQDSCKILGVTSTVDVDIPDEIAPGFDDIAGSSSKKIKLSPTSAQVKILMNEQVGPVSRSRLTDLFQKFLNPLTYPVTLDLQLAHFPQPVGTENRALELREKIAKQFRSTLDSLFTQFCPDQCLLVDFDIQTETVNAEEAQFANPGEIVQSGGVALRIKELSGTVLMDNLLTSEEQANVLEMARLKTNTFKNVELKSKVMRFPMPSARAIAMSGTGNGIGSGTGSGASTLSSVKNDSLSNSQENKTLSTQETQNRSLASTTQSQNEIQENKASNSTENKVSSNQSSENNQRQERFERFEKIERVENGDAVQAELKKFQLYALIFGCAVLSILVFLSVASLKGKSGESPIARILHENASGYNSPSAQAGAAAIQSSGGSMQGEVQALIAKRYEIERLQEELTQLFAQQPKVAKQVFSRVLTEEGIETTSQYIHIFGEGIVMDMLRDPSLQGDLSELMEFYAKNPVELKDEDKLTLLKNLHNRAVAGKLFVMGNRSSNLFDFLGEMDGLQILELIRTESLTVKAMVLTQVDPQKRQAIYTQLDEDTRLRLLSELSRIDYLPRDYIFNVSHALKRKKKDNPRLNTEALPGSEVLVNLLERTGLLIQKSVMKNLELTAPESARTVKSKLVSIETLRYLRDGQLLEVVLSLRHDELLQFLKGAPEEIRTAIFSKSPKELILELEEELSALPAVTRETYLNIERKVLNRMKIMANEGLVNLVEVNERMFSDHTGLTGQFVMPGQTPVADAQNTASISSMKKTG